MLKTAVVRGNSQTIPISLNAASQVAAKHACVSFVAEYHCTAKQICFCQQLCVLVRRTEKMGARFRAVAASINAGPKRILRVGRCKCDNTSEFIIRGKPSHCYSAEGSRDQQCD